jgi:hypothetical protein
MWKEESPFLFKWLLGLNLEALKIKTRAIRVFVRVTMHQGLQK